MKSRACVRMIFTSRADGSALIEPDFMSLNTSPTYYLLRAKTTTVGDGPYVGLAADGVHTMVMEPLQARRFGSLDEAEQHAGTISENAGAFEIEVRTAD